MFLLVFLAKDCSSRCQEPPPAFSTNPHREHTSIKIKAAHFVYFSPEHGRTDFDKYMKICLSNTKYKMCYKEKITYIRNIVI